MIPYGKHSINEDDVAAVATVLRQEYLTQGSQVPAFEQALCDYTKAQHAIAVNSGTSGLHIACLAADVGPGDIVWTVPNSFAASANCARYCGANVDFVDIDPLTRNMSVEALQHKLEVAKTAGHLPKAMVVVHFAGSSCDMKAIAELVSGLNITLIEDAAHALGAADSQQHKVGQCFYSDMTVFSFHPVKSITTAEGGAVMTNSSAMAHRLRRLASHGITRDEALIPVAHQQEGWFYAQMELGYNYRLSDIHAALGRTQLRKLDSFVALRQQKMKFYDEALATLPLKLPVRDPISAGHLYVVELQQHDRETVFNELRARGVGVHVHYIPIHWHPYYQRLGFKKGQFPASEAYYENALTLPLFPDLARGMQNEVVTHLTELLG